MCDEPKFDPTKIASWIEWRHSEKGALNARAIIRENRDESNNVPAKKPRIPSDKH